MSCLDAIVLFEGQIHGSVKFHQCTHYPKTLVVFDLHGFEPNAIHAIHIHEYGDLRDGCNSLGPHWNPHSKPHGSIFINPLERHSGDLINNLKSNNNGSFELHYEDNLIDVNEIYGRSVVIHTGIDDLGEGGNVESLKTGNAGSRMACAIIGRADRF